MIDLYGDGEFMCPTCGGMGYARRAVMHVVEPVVRDPAVTPPDSRCA
jgi:hypothetical protein